MKRKRRKRERERERKRRKNWVTHLLHRFNDVDVRQFHDDDDDDDSATRRWIKSRPNFPKVGHISTQSTLK